MSYRHELICIFLVHMLFDGMAASANVRTIAITGGDAAGVVDAGWEDFRWATLNNGGSLSFHGTLIQDGVTVTSSNDTGAWLFDYTGGSLLVREGSGMVPEIAGADFDRVNQVTINDDGDVWIGSSLVNGVGGIGPDTLGFWQYADVGNSLVARTGDGDVPGVPAADYLTFPIGNVGAMSVAPQQYIAYAGRLTPGVAGVTTNNESGIWSYSASGGTLVAREGVGNVPGVGGANFESFNQPKISSAEQLLVQASLRTGGGVTFGNFSGIWRYSGTSGELLARTGSGNVPDVTGLDFSRFDQYEINEQGQSVVRAQLSDASAGAWLYDGPTGSLVARTGTMDVPDVPGATFADIPSATINDAGQVLLWAQLEPGVGGVTVDDHWGLWLMDDNSRLVARRGSGNVPGVPGASFLDFGNATLNDRGQVAFLASFELEGTTALGIWIIEHEGDSVLVARTDDQLAGRTITSLSFEDDSFGRPGGFNDHGLLTFRATFDNSDSGMFLYNPNSADFDWDGDVDDNDLNVWHADYATGAVADADADGDADGSDFLAWQLEYGNGGAIATINVVVPEPSSVLLIYLGLLCRSRAYHRRRD